MARPQGTKTAELKIANALRKKADELDLSGCGLKRLPDLGDRLAHLKKLRLTNNRLTTLPETLSRFRHLESLDLSSNRLRELPQSLGQLTKLESFNLASNRLASLPESIGSLIRLGKLDLRHNQFSGLPDTMAKMGALKILNMGSNRLENFPRAICKVASLVELQLWENQLTEIPEDIAKMRSLEYINVQNNQITKLPESLGDLPNLEKLWLGSQAGGNPLKQLPDCIGRLKSLKNIQANFCHLTSLPGWIGELRNLESIEIHDNKINDLPHSLGELKHLKKLRLSRNPLNPELDAAHKDGLDAVKRYLRAKAGAQVALNEAKLILIGEGEVGKSCLLAALRDDPWEENRPTTHGIEIKPVKVTHPVTKTKITLNGWDFGGQRVYRPTHQLFFTAPAVYVVVWKPREGPQQGFVKEWIKLVKHREPEAKILIVATHGGPRERQPDIDRQEIWDLFGRETVIDFLSVESKPNPKGQRPDMVNLKEAIARVAADLPEMGRSFPKQWQAVRQKLSRSKEAYLPLERVFALCRERGIEQEDARLLLRICCRVGDLIHYEHDPALRDLVVLKPDWLATAISYVLDDKQTRDAHGLVEFGRLSEVWSDPSRPKASRYEKNLHPLFLRLMERFDLSYKVAVPAQLPGVPGHWPDSERDTEIDEQESAGPLYTSLIAQLVPDVRPESKLARRWPGIVPKGDEQQVQICRIVETKTGQSATAEGLFFQLIVRLHKYSLGRQDHLESTHWQRGLVLDDDYNGRALLEHIGNDVRITVRAAYPQAFLAVLTSEVKWLVESFWKGMRCEVMVPCIEPCGKNAPGTGLFEVQKLIQSKRRGRPEYPCPICDEWQSIDCLLHNAPTAQRDPMGELFAEFTTIKQVLKEAQLQLTAMHGEAMGRFDGLDLNTQRILSKVDEAFTGLMNAYTDEAKEGPRLFSFEPVDPGFFDRPKWVSQKFRITLWCEHSRLPLPILNSQDNPMGVYELSLSRKWFVKAAPLLKLVTGTLSLVMPIASSATKLILDEAAYKGMEKQLDLGQKSLDSVLKGSEKAVDWLARSDGPDAEQGGLVEAHGAALRQIQVWLKEKDPGFGGLVRVQNKRQAFLWVHHQFEHLY